MTYFLKDCDRKASPPAKGREDIARSVAETFATRPYIRFTVLIAPYSDGSRDDSVELIVVPDRKFGVPRARSRWPSCLPYRGAALATRYIREIEKGRGRLSVPSLSYNAGSSVTSS